MTVIGEAAEIGPIPALQTELSEAPARGKWAWVRRWMTWRLLLAVVLVLQVAPIWLVTYLPTQDGPAHIYNSRIFFDQFDRSNYQIRQTYEFGYQLYPNMLSHLAMGVLQEVMPGLVAEKIVVSLIVLLVPLSLLYLLNGIERGNGVMCLIGLTFAYHNLLHIGFYNFSLSVSMCLFALGWWWRHKDQMTLPRLGVFYLLSALTYVSHFAGFMALVMTVTIAVAWIVLLRGLTALVRIRGGTLKADVRRAAGWAVGGASILLPLWAIGWDYNFRYYNPLADGHRPLEELMEVFRETLTLMSYTRDWHLQFGQVVLYTMAAVAGLTILYRMIRLQVLQERDALLLACGALVYLYFTLPWSRNAGGWVNDRLYIIAFLLAWAWFGRFHKPLNVLVGIVLIGLGAAHTGRLAVDYWRLQPELRELAAAVDRIEPHSTVAWELNTGFRPEAFPEGTELVNPWLHALSYYGLQKDVALFSNYEADQPYFLTRWSDTPRRDPDYVVAFGNADQPQRIERHLEQYEVIQKSTHLSLLRRKRLPPDLTTWTRSPDGRQSLKLRFGRRDVVEGMQGVDRARLFATGSFGWVRVPARSQWRSPAGLPGYPDLVGDQRDRTFRIDLPNGRYTVTCHFSTHADGAYETRVIANDQPVGHATVADQGEPQTLRYSVEVTNGQLTQTFYTSWRSSPDKRRKKFWAVSGIEIEAETSVP